MSLVGHGNSFRPLTWRSTSGWAFFLTVSLREEVFLTIFKWNHLTLSWNDLTIMWNDLTWNDLTMERGERKPLIANEAAEPRGKADKVVEHRAIREWEKNAQLLCNCFFFPYLGVSNTPYLGSDVTLLAFVPRLDSEPACSLLNSEPVCRLTRS